MGKGGGEERGPLVSEKSVVLRAAICSSEGRWFWA